MESLFQDIYEKNENMLTERVRQGDIIKSELIRTKLSIKNSIVGWMVINAECDLEHSDSKLDWFNFAAVRPVRYFIYAAMKSITGSDRDNQVKNKLMDLIKNKYRKLYFLPEKDGLWSDGAYVDLGLIQVLPINWKDKRTNQINPTMVNLLDMRLVSLKETWRTDIAQHYSSFFGRHGTPDHQIGRIKDWGLNKVKTLNFGELEKEFTNG